MNHIRSALLAFLVILMAFGPASAEIQNPQESTPTTLYYHIFDTFNNFVINTQPMDAAFFEVGGTSFPTVSGTPANEAIQADYDLNTIYGTSTAGPVEYGYIENGKPRFHPERGIAADVKIDETVEPVSYLYMDVRDITGLNDAPNVLPQLTVRFTMRTGDAVGTDADYDSGDLIMTGQKTATVCSNGNEVPAPAQDACSEAAAVTDVLLPDSSGIVEFAVPMILERSVIPKADAFNMRIDWWQEDPSGQVCGEDQCAEGYLRLIADQEHLPRLEMNILNPIYIDFIHPQVAAGTLLIHTGVNSPWGTYDVDGENIRLGISGPSTPADLQRIVVKNEHVHNRHDQAAEITYLWKFRAESAKNGEYTIDFAISNIAGTATATGQAMFRVESKEAFGYDDQDNIVLPSTTSTDEAQESPAPGLILPLLGMLVLLMRRRSP